MVVMTFTNAVKHLIDLTKPSLGIISYCSTGNGGGFRHVYAPVKLFQARTSPIYKSDYRDGLDAVDENGCISVPEGPGLGVEYDWDFIVRNRVDGVEYK